MDENTTHQKQGRRRLRLVWAVILALVLTCVVAFAVYVNDYYHAEDIAVEAMASSTAVDVYEWKDGYTVFAPETPTAGLIFYPGGKVEHMAYAPLLRECAERGVLCVLVEMPCNLAVFGVNAADGVVEQFPEINRKSFL